MLVAGVPSHPGQMAGSCRKRETPQEQPRADATTGRASGAWLQGDFSYARIKTWSFVLAKEWLPILMNAAGEKEPFPIDDEVSAAAQLR